MTRLTPAWPKSQILGCSLTIPSASRLILSRGVKEGSRVPGPPDGQACGDGGAMPGEAKQLASESGRVAVAEWLASLE